MLLKGTFRELFRAAKCRRVADAVAIDGELLLGQCRGLHPYHDVIVWYAAQKHTKKSEVIDAARALKIVSAMERMG